MSEIARVRLLALWLRIWNELHLLRRRPVSRAKCYTSHDISRLYLEVSSIYALEVERLAPIFCGLNCQHSYSTHTHLRTSQTVVQIDIAGGVAPQIHNAECVRLISLKRALSTLQHVPAPADPLPHTSGTAFSPDASHHGGRAQQARRET